MEDDSISYRVKVKTEAEQATKDREAIIKQLADARIGQSTGGTLINIGGHHAQKSPLMGTEEEWLGDYLAHRSEPAAGSVLSILSASSRTELEPGASGTPWDITTSEAGESDIYRALAEMWPEKDVFLWLDDPMFAEHRVAVYSEEVVYAAALRQQFDAVMKYGLAHRMPDK